MNANQRRHTALRKLAAAVLTLACEDYAKPGAQRETRKECAQFLVRNTVWHQVLDLNPECCAEWLKSQIEGRRKGNG